MTGAAPRTAGVAQEPADVAGAEDAGGRRVSALLERVIARAARLAESATGSADVRGAATAAGVGRGTRAAVERAAEERLTEPAVYEAPERNVGIGKGGRVPRGVAGARDLIGRVTSTLAPNEGYALKGGQNRCPSTLPFERD